MWLQRKGYYAAKGGWNQSRECRAAAQGTSVSGLKNEVSYAKLLYPIKDRPDASRNIDPMKGTKQFP
jgi:hypothetical protein